jgi:hypothetical protein
MRDSMLASNLTNTVGCAKDLTSRLIKCIRWLGVGIVVAVSSAEMLKIISPLPTFTRTTTYY